MTDARPSIALVHHDAAELADAYAGVIREAVSAGLDVVVVAPRHDALDALARPGVHLRPAPVSARAAGALAVPIIAGALIEHQVALVHAMSTNASVWTQLARAAGGRARSVVTLDGDASNDDGRSGLRRQLGDVLSRGRLRVIDAAIEGAARVVVFDPASAQRASERGVSSARLARFDGGMGVDVDAVADPSVAPEAARARARARLDVAQDAVLVAVWPADACAGVKSATRSATPTPTWLPLATDERRMHDALRAADVVVVATQDRAAQRVAMLAAAAGVPVVVSDGALLRQVVRDRETGCVAGTAATALADGVASLVGDAAARVRMGESARRLARRAFDRDLAQRRLLGIYESVLRGGDPMHVTADGRLVGASSVPGRGRELA